MDKKLFKHMTFISSRTHKKKYKTLFPLTKNCLATLETAAYFIRDTSGPVVTATQSMFPRYAKGVAPPPFLGMVT